jgi:CelD/BcsL family acetyltransferase involved in cellulose biosynthesis
MTDVSPQMTVARAAEPEAWPKPPGPGRAAVLPFALFLEDPTLAAQWRRLERFATLPTQGFDFAAAVASAFDAAAGIDVLTIRSGGEIVALLPLCREAPATARSRMIGEALCEPGDALCRDRGAADALARAVADAGRPLEIDRVPADSPLIPALRSAMRGRGLVSLRPAMAAPTIALDGRWKDPASLFNAGRRSDFRRAERRAAELGEVRFEMLSPGPGEFDALFDEAVAVEARSWKREAGTAIAVDRFSGRFFRDYFRACAVQGTLRIAFMRIAGRAVAMQMALEWAERFWLFKIGFDEEFGRCSPGALLMLHSLGWAAERELRSFELLGTSEAWIAQLWTRESRECVRLRAYPLTPPGAAALAADAGLWLRTRLRPRAG